MTMIAIVMRVNPGSLLVRDTRNNEEVLVNFHRANQFAVRDRIRIFFNGQKTLSIPPQITATSIQRIGEAGHPQQIPSQMRALVLQIERGFLMLWDLQENRLIRAEFSNAHHFRVGQQVIVSYDTITMGNPPRITATNIRPL